MSGNSRFKSLDTRHSFTQKFSLKLHAYIGTSSGRFSRAAAAKFQHTDAHSHTLWGRGAGKVSNNRAADQLQLRSLSRSTSTSSLQLSLLPTIASTLPLLLSLILTMSCSLPPKWPQQLHLPLSLSRAVASLWLSRLARLRIFGVVRLVRNGISWQRCRWCNRAHYSARISSCHAHAGRSQELAAPPAASSFAVDNREAASREPLIALRGCCYCCCLLSCCCCCCTISVINSAVRCELMLLGT